ncbi:MAG: type transport system permease protein [Acidimicrobiaceae bacterium]|nr:type transport system permease protein [Acidimicrobiaceae bacterium]
MADIWRYRELLVGLVRKELKVKYKNSILGFVWSMLNPALYLVVFYVVFQLVLKAGIPNFAIYLLSGLLVWNLFSTGLPGATGSIVGNAAIVKKVAFPREILAMAAVGASLVHFVLQGAVMLLALLFFRYPPSPGFLLLVPVALLALLLFTCALGILLAAVNVYLRDTQHLLELALLAWFWGTPIVYQYRLVADRLGSRTWLYRLNPITPIVLTFQRAIYAKTDPNGVPILPAGASPGWYLGQLGAVIAVSLALFVFALRVFGKLEGNFAEEL